MQYIASVSYGKDSLAMLEIIKQHVEDITAYENPTKSKEIG